MPDVMDNVAARLLLVDDDEVDALGFLREFKKRDISASVAVAHNGEDALAMLRGESGYSKMPAPCIVLLDLNMPRMNGIEFLQELRADPELKNTVVFVLTTSMADEDRRLAYQHNVAGYVCKASPEDSVKKFAELLQLYWSIVRLPRAG